MKKWVAFGWFASLFLLGNLAFGQLRIAAQQVAEVRGREGMVEVAALPSGQVLIWSEGHNRLSNTIEAQCFTNDLGVDWEASLPVPVGAKRVGNAANAEWAWILYQDSLQLGQALLYWFHLPSGEAHLDVLELPRPMVTTHFICADNNLILGGLIDGQASGVRYALANGVIELLFHHLEGPTRLCDLSYQSSIQAVSFLHEHNGHFYLNQFEPNGQIIGCQSFVLPPTVVFADFDAVYPERNACLLMGTFREHAEQGVDGLLTVSIRDREVAAVRAYPFYEMEEMLKIPYETRLVKGKSDTRKGKRFFAQGFEQVVKEASWKGNRAVFSMYLSPRAYLRPKSPYQFRIGLVAQFHADGRWAWGTHSAHLEPNLPNGPLDAHQLLAIGAEGEQTWLVQRVGYLFKAVSEGIFGEGSQLSIQALDEDYLLAKNKVIFQRELKPTGTGQFIYAELFQYKKSRDGALLVSLKLLAAEGEALSNLAGEKELRE